MENGKFLISAFLILHFTFLVFNSANAQSSVLDLNDAIQARKQEQLELQKKISRYQNEIRATQKKAASLINQINILEADIKQTELEVEQKKLEAQQLELEAQVIESAIADEEKRQNETLDDIGALLRKVRTFDDQKYITVVLAEHSFSAVFDQLFYSERLVRAVKGKLDEIKRVRALLEQNQILLAKKQGEAIQKQEELGILADSFVGEKRIKEALFGKTKATEAEFQILLTELREVAAALDSEIVTLEKKIRERLDLADKLAGDTGLLSWPVNPTGGISAAFHDPEYPFRYLFEHAGIDIRAKQETPVRAAASGYVAKTYNGGLGIRPSYIMLVHGSNMSTVYMHVSRINIPQDIFVARGDIIGYSGGTPKTPGAGRWSTGPHLHFETRLSGVPVNPIDYLP